MSAGQVAQRIYSDIRRIVVAPYKAVREIQYTINGLREGKIPPKFVAWTIVSTTAAMLIAALLMFPIYWILITALDPSASSIYTAGGVEIIPDSVSIKNFIWVIGPITTPEAINVSLPFVGELFSIPVPDAIGNRYIINPGAFGVEESRQSGRFIAYAKNSMYVAFWTALIGMSVIIPGAYGMSRRDFVGRKRLLYVYVLLTQVAGGLGIALLIALYTIFNMMGWLDPGANTRFWLAVYYAGGAVPFNTWLLKTYMDGIPVSYEEAAIVDGAPSWRLVYEVIIPLSKAGLATVFVFVFLAGWTEYIVAQTLLDAADYTLPVGLYALIGEYSVDWPKFAAFALSFATPLMLVYFFMQRYIEAGLSFGGMEG
ncbi:sugar ABC transporter permease [Halapricum hydrolyticum]|uniref:ABC transporter permease subunit n=1 Tax=Halapricum hydrolyticum TaxID=2979991 RepID=A0AAE3IAG3_9EURY|nr:ABC transporter permease subunit [Halapricum hydrolyticum]MCU4717157.1 ABC transporter permease subunit [Halapricum hydrolyticum]MCU4726084.1 ABC transporter permease subunit [Halapricum hydrolyticum]